MGIKSLTKTIQRFSPDSIQVENLYKLSGKRVAVDASLVIYQQLLKCPKGKLFKNSKDKITNHITGLFYKIMNYVSLNIELIFIFDGKPPDNKKDCIDLRKEKCQKAKDSLTSSSTEEERNRVEKASLRLTPEMINDIKHLLHLMGISYIQSDGEGEAIASELCRMGFVDYVLTEDMDTMVYGCPKLIRNCTDKSLKRKDIVSIFDYNKVIEGLKIDHDKFVDFCILCGCDYCPVVPKIGHITAYKLIQKHNSIEDIIKNTEYKFPEGYLKLFNDAKINFNLYRDKLKLDDLKINSSTKNISDLSKYLIQEIEMNEKRVHSTIKKYHNNYKINNQ